MFERRGLSQSVRFGIDARRERTNRFDRRSRSTSGAAAVVSSSFSFSVSDCTTEVSTGS